MIDWYDYERAPSPNQYTTGILPVECLILHYTAGYSAASSVGWFCNPASKASAHFVVDRDGHITQCVSLENRAWHAGGETSRWRGKPVNRISIGIEIANLGPIHRENGLLYDAYGKLFKGPTVAAANGSLWEEYPKSQIDAVYTLCQRLCTDFPVLTLRDEHPVELPRICGHQHVDPTRKTDPGPAFPMEFFQNSLAHRRMNAPK